jgi:hypothetical protein
MNPNQSPNKEQPIMDATERVEAARDKLAHEMRTLVGDAEMLRAASKQGGEHRRSARTPRTRQHGEGRTVNAEHAIVERARPPPADRRVRSRSSVERSRVGPASAAARPVAGPALSARRTRHRSLARR